MKVTFFTTKSNENGVRNEVAPFQTKAHLSLEIRAHKKNEQLIVVTLSSRMDQIQDNFRRYLKMREAQGMLKALKIEEIDAMGYATINGVRQEVKA